MILVFEYPIIPLAELEFHVFENPVLALRRPIYLQLLSCACHGRIEDVVSYEVFDIMRDDNLDGFVLQSLGFVYGNGIGYLKRDYPTIGVGVRILVVDFIFHFHADDGAFVVAR